MNIFKRHEISGGSSWQLRVGFDRSGAEDLQKGSIPFLQLVIYISHYRK